LRWQRVEECATSRWYWWVEQTVKGPTAGFHAHGHGRLGKSIVFHGGFDPVRENVTPFEKRNASKSSSGFVLMKCPYSDPMPSL
jgi:hypothetical protein